MAKPECILRLLKRNSALIDGAQRVIRAFEVLGHTGDIDIMQRRECENAMVALKDIVTKITTEVDG